MSNTETYCEELFGMSYEQAERFYLDYVNNYLTVEHFAEVNNMPMFLAEKIINIGREFNHKR